MSEFVKSTRLKALSATLGMGKVGILRRQAIRAWLIVDKLKG